MQLYIQAGDTGVATSGTGMYEFQKWYYGVL